MEDLEIKKYLIALGIPKILWNWSIDEKPDKHTKTIKEIGDNIKDTLREGYSFRIHLSDDVESGRLAVYLIKCALKEDFLRVGYITPHRLAEIYTASWEGSEEYDGYSSRDLIVIDQMTLDNFRDALKMSVFVGFVRARLFMEKSTILVESDNVLFPGRFKQLLDNSGKLVKIK